MGREGKGRIPVQAWPCLAAVSAASLLPPHQNELSRVESNLCPLTSSVENILLHFYD